MDDLVEVLDGLRAERSSPAAADDTEPPVERFEVLGSEASQLGVAEIGEEVVLDGGDVAGVGGRRDRCFLGGEPLADQVLAQRDRRPGAVVPFTSLSERSGELLGIGAVLAAMPPPPLPTRHRVHSLVDDRVEHATLLHFIRHFALHLFAGIGSGLGSRRPLAQTNWVL